MCLYVHVIQGQCEAVNNLFLFCRDNKTAFILLTHTHQPLPVKVCIVQTYFFVVLHTKKSCARCDHIIQTLPARVQTMCNVALPNTVVT